jgi:hypothetical protein
VFPHGHHLTEEEFKTCAQNNTSKKTGKVYIGSYDTGVNIIYLQHYFKLASIKHKY